MAVAELIVTDTSYSRGPAGRAIEMVCKFFAICSGMVLTAMAVMSIGSIVGRTFFSSPIVGDYELVQALCAVAVSMSLPYTHWIRGHVIVDFFTAHAGPRFNALLDLLANLILALFSAVITWRIWKGLWELKDSMEASMLLDIPTWWSYAPMVPSFALLCITALYAAGDDVRKMQS
jgi:TRAP-type C4-dicarboxylate transport system permease small subunit